MGDEERARILRMVAEGKLSPDEAVGLLDAVEDAVRRTSNEREERPERPERIVHGRGYGRPMSRRAVVIQIREGSDTKVNIRIPLSLARAAGKFIPRQAQTYLANYEIDLKEFLADAGDAESGTLLEVKDGESQVLIAVE